jgi:FixJ family two-component response regulator
VDDDDLVREGLSYLVRSLGYEVNAFASAEDYLSSTSIADTSCLITDMNMPGMSGGDLQRRLLADGYRMPVIFMSASPEEQVRARVGNAGTVRFMKKPIDPEYLIQYLKKALND